MKWENLKEQIKKTIEYGKSTGMTTELERGFVYGLEEALDKMNALEEEENKKSAHKTR